MKYVNAYQQWNKIRPFASLPQATCLWYPAMQQFNPTEHRTKRYPMDFESLDWRLGSGYIPHPMHKYVCARACHFLVNLNLFLATSAYPDEDWCIATSPKHSTVWNQKDLLFDLNFLAFGVLPDICWKDAGKHKKSKILNPGQFHVLP